MAEIKLDFKNSGVTQKSIMEYKAQVEIIHKDLHRRANDEKDFVGWLDLPTNYDKDEFERIKKAAKKIQSNSEVLIVIGIGGSYLGGRAALEFVNGVNFNKKVHKGIPEVYFVGNSISSDYLSDIIEILGDRDFSINVISKSGTTTEPAISFRIFREILENKYGIDEARSRIYATTDKAKGALKVLAQNEGYEQFVVPDNVGGRYSVLTAVGLLPIATAGIDIDKLTEGAKIAQERYDDPNLKYNECYQYAVIRNILYKLKFR